MDGSTLHQLVTTEWMLSQTTAYPGRTASELVSIALSLDRVEARVEILVFAAVRCYILQEPEAVSLRVATELSALHSTGQDALIEVGSGLVAPGKGIDVDRALEAFQGPITAVDAVLLNCLAFAEEEAQDLRGAERVWTSATAAYHEAARTGDEATGLCGRSSVRLTLGEVRSGMADAEHALRLSDDLSLGVVGAMAATVIAQARGQRGELELAREALEAVITRAGPKPFARIAASMAWAEGVVAAAEGRHADAVIHLQRTKENPPIALWAGAALAESAMRSGRADLVEEWLRRARPLAESSGSHFLGMLVDRTNGLLDEAQAERYFESALAHGLLAESPVEVARTRMYFGEWLRRNRRVKDARELLRSALAVFESESMGPSITRASQELRAAGEGGRSEAGPALDPAELLTGQELLIARHAANGMTNKEIADSIYLSHRTVGAHLHRAFAKLGISRRSQLSGVLGNS
jgi:ATP/maltotriose-dependent transcriptional regulator MalT